MSDHYLDARRSGPSFAQRLLNTPQQASSYSVPNMTEEDQVKAATQASLQMELNQVAVEVIDVDHDDDGGGKPSPICLDGTGGGCKVRTGYISTPFAFLSIHCG